MDAWTSSFQPSHLLSMVTTYRLSHVSVLKDQPLFPTTALPVPPHVSTQRIPPCNDLQSSISSGIKKGRPG